MAENSTDYEMNPRALLKASVLFEGLDEAAIDAVEQELDFRHLESGEILFAEGAPGNSLYLVINGRLRVFQNSGPGAEQRALGEIGAGETVGEIALITGEKRSATVCAIRDTDLLKFSKRAFEHLLNEHPGAMFHLTRLMVTRLREGEKQDPHREFSTLTLIPVGRDFPVDTVSRAIAGALEVFGTTLMITSDFVDESLGRGSAQSQQENVGQKRITAWLNAREDENRYLVFLADAEDSQWTRRCIRHADRMLYLVDVRDEARSHPAEHYIDNELTRLNQPVKELLLLQSNRGGPGSARHWLAQLQVDGWHHVHAERASDYRRVARLLTGNATTLVLGGGGARGFAHIGVFRALHEAGVEIDALDGTSMGAIIGAQIAMNWSPEEMLERNRKAFALAKALHDFTLPIISLLRGRRGERLLAEFYDDIHIEDLYYDFFCVSTNLSRADIVVHRRGRLLAAVRASIAVPGILPPMFFCGDVLVDGGMLNNLPVDVMQELHRGEVIAVDVSPVEDLATRPDYEETPSAWKLLWQELSPTETPPKFPKIFDILMRSATIGSTRAAEQMSHQVGLFLHPPIEVYGMTEWSAFDQLVDIGYRSSQAPIDAWLRNKES